MELILALLLGFGLGVVTLSPFVPGLRPIVQKAVCAGLAAGATAAMALAATGHRWMELVAEARAEREAAAAEKAAAAAAETITISLPEKY